MRELIAHADLGGARDVFELGCGTGRFAAEILAHHLPPDASYLGVDLSSTMLRLAGRRLAPFGARARVEPSAGPPRIPAADASLDRVLSNYVLDLLGEEDIRTFFREARRSLRAEGRLALTGLTHGRAGAARFVSFAWQRLHALQPRLVGGCRPLEMLEFVSPPEWRILHHDVVTAFGVSSEVLVAAPGAKERAGGA